MSSTQSIITQRKAFSDAVKRISEEVLRRIKERFPGLEISEKSTGQLCIECGNYREVDVFVRARYQFGYGGRPNGIKISIQPPYFCGRAYTVQKSGLEESFNYEKLLAALDRVLSAVRIANENDNAQRIWRQEKARREKDEIGNLMEMAKSRGICIELQRDGSYQLTMQHRFQLEQVYKLLGFLSRIDPLTVERSAVTVSQ